MAVEDDIIAEQEGGATPPRTLTLPGAQETELSRAADQVRNTSAPPPTPRPVQGPEITNYERQSLARNNSISLPDTSPEGGTFETASALREQRIADRSPFNAPFTTDQRGNRTAIQQGVGEQGQRFTLRPPSDVRNILTDGPQSQRDVTRIKRFAGTSPGKSFDFGQFNQSLAQLRRNTLGQKEFERQMDSAFRNGTPIYGDSPPNAANPGRDDVLDSEEMDTTMADNDFTDYTSELLA